MIIYQIQIQKITKIYIQYKIIIKIIKIYLIENYYQEENININWKFRFIK